MQRDGFKDEIANLQRAIARAPLRAFAVPHLVVDNLFPAGLVKLINANWPSSECFQPEVPGNYIVRFYRDNYLGLSGQKREFWAAFNEHLWPALLAACAEALSEPALEVFGDLYQTVLSLDGEWPLTLMQADATYPGHKPHQHFYHAPHWAFTVLVYIDPDDSYSKGTGIHRLRRQGEGKPAEDGSRTSYQSDDLDWRLGVAMSSYRWHLLPGQPFERSEIEYRAGRMFVFQDGPLAIHSVSFDKDFIPNPERATHAVTQGRRRILRCHVKVHHQPFYDRHSAMLPEPLDPTRFMRVMDRDAQLSSEDLRYRDTVVRLFYRERLEAYARAAQRAAGSRRHRFLNRLFAPGRPSPEYATQFAERVP